MSQEQRLVDYLRELHSLPAEKPLVPELKGPRQEQDKKIKEDQDLFAGAVLQATVEAGQGEETPAPEDLVYVQYSVRDAENDLVASTRSEEGGPGQAFAFRLEKGLRVPRGLELVVKGMTRLQRVAVKVRQDYGFQHPDCTLKPPKGARPDKPMTFDVQLMNWYAAAEVRHLGPSGDVYKRTLKEGINWESPRPPFEVTVHITACTPAFNGVQMRGDRYYSSEQGGEKREPLHVQLGSNQLPAGVEDAIGSMSKDEVAIFVIPADEMASPPPRDQGSGRTSNTCTCLMPAPPAGARQVEVHIQLLDLVQVRDMTGNGEVMKRRLREGTGDFPIDCPLNDTTVRVHYRVRAVQGGVPCQWVYDSRQQQDAISVATVGADAAPAPVPVELDTGCGEAPEALELCAKLMVPGELAIVTCTPRYAYAERSDSPPGISGRDDTVEFEVELVSFDKEGHWQAISMPDRFELAERMKGKANELFKARKFQYAKSRYDRLLRLLSSTRDYEHDDDTVRIEAYRVAVTGNLAACCLAVGEYAQAVKWCSKALRMDGVDACKMLLRRGRAHSLNGDYDRAEEDLQLALELENAEGDDAELRSTQEAVADVGSGVDGGTGAGTERRGGTVAGGAAEAAAARASRVAAIMAELATTRQRAKAAQTKQKQQFRNFFDRS